MAASDRYVSNLELFLLKEQVDDETKQATLDATDFADVTSDSTSDFEPEVETPKMVSGSFDQDAAVVGKQTSSATLTYPLRSFGEGVEPDFFAAFRCADFEDSESAGYRVLTPSSSGGSSGTIWHYEGRQGATNVHKMYNWKPNWKITGETGKPVTAEFQGNGAFDSYDSGAMPTVSKSRAVIPALLNATILINGFAYKLISFDIDGGQSHDLTVDPSAENACGQNVLTDRAIILNAAVYMQDVAVVNPVSALTAESEAAVEIYWGSANDIKIDATYSQIREAKRGDQNGVKKWDLTLQLNRNDFTLSVADSSIV